MSNAGKVTIVTLIMIGFGLVVALVTMPILGAKGAVNVASPFVLGAPLFFVAAILYECWLSRKGGKS